MFEFWIRLVGVFCIDRIPISDLGCAAKALVDMAGPCFMPPSLGWLAALSGLIGIRSQSENIAVFAFSRFVLC